MFRRIGIWFAVVALCVNFAGVTIHGGGMALAAAPGAGVAEKTGDEKLDALLADLLVLCTASGLSADGEPGQPAASFGDCAVCLHGNMGACAAHGGMAAGGFLGLAVYSYPPLETHRWEGNEPRISHPREPPILL